MRSMCQAILLAACQAVLAVHAQSGEAPQSVAPRQVDEPVQADAAAPPPPGIVDMDTVVVSGVQPGPGMWRVSKDDHVLYVLGTLSPLPKHMEWASREVEDTIARSQAVLEPPAVVMRSDIGFFRRLSLVPALLRARNNPGKEKLQDMVSPELYARWLVLKARYIGRDRGVEKRRPILAAQELYEAAIHKSGLQLENVAGKVVKKAAKRAGVPTVPAEAELVIEDPKAVLKEFNAITLADTGCFAGTMARIETDLDNMRARANAWAVGDIEALRALPFHNQYADCVDAITGTSLARRLGIDGLLARAEQAWMDAAEDALAKNAITFATLPMGEVLSDKGYLAKLRAKGYRVEAP
ncbi:TraB/GumN family protein [Luteimonas lutimaris]|uniref:TraB/GumN family protein n=1 Tax=Luteimonas lutimaris TaxID=698645 RepID=A0ABP7MU54_9GAMM